MLATSVLPNGMCWQKIRQGRQYPPADLTRKKLFTAGKLVNESGAINRHPQGRCLLAKSSSLQVEAYADDGNGSANGITVSTCTVTARSGASGSIAGPLQPLTVPRVRASFPSVTNCVTKAVILCHWR
ncbi:hypothetical protein BaRGS_00009414 [Batillaria attramentaria]|uniref:Uncharacterized protein n=1 Tax=Batillaria attramentaria TaxID=370345 RepID=A0ABD0LIU5_9CAEN